MRSHEDTLCDDVLHTSYGSRSWLTLLAMCLVQGSPLQLREAGSKPAPITSQLVSGEHPVAGSWTLSLSQHPATGSFASTSLVTLPCSKAARIATALSSSA